MLKFLTSWLNSFRPAPRGYPTENTVEPAQVTRIKVLVLMYDPIMDQTTGTTLSKR
ncbi:MAG: hypothetical protein HC797_01605 [Anaerolineales bacterium]|nr:hypothetical protein [Anaerolineales bacterium]